MKWYFDISTRPIRQHYFIHDQHRKVLQTHVRQKSIKCRWAELLKLMNNIGRQIPLASEMWIIRFIVHIAVRCINLLISMLMALTSKSETGLYSSWMHGARTPSAHSAQFNKFYFFFIIIVTNILFDLFSLSLALFRVAKNIEKKISSCFMFGWQRLHQLRHARTPIPMSVLVCECFMLCVARESGSFSAVGDWVVWHAIDSQIVSNAHAA